MSETNLTGTTEVPNLTPETQDSAYDRVLRLSVLLTDKEKLLFMRQWMKAIAAQAEVKHESCARAFAELAMIRL